MSNNFKPINHKYLTIKEREALKQFILEHKIDGEAAKLSLKAFLLYQREKNGLYYPTINNYSFEKLINEKKTFIKKYGSTTLKVANNLNQAKYQRTIRLKKRIQEAVESGLAYFITITFNPETLKNTNEQTRRKYVSRWLKSLSEFYVANIDYGLINEREHYHAVIVSDNKPPKSWSYGFIDILKIKTSENDTKRISKYISKLTNHAIKHTTKSKRIIYSKKSK